MIEESKELSIIVVHYYSEHRHNMLLKNVDNLLQQTFSDFELVLVIDNTNILPKFLFKKLESLCVKTNISFARRGAAWCRKIGVELSTGKFIAFLDDDAIPKNTWAENILVGIKNSGLVGVGGKTLSSNIKTKSQMFFDLDNSQRFPLVDNHGKIFNISTVNACFKRDALKKTGVVNNKYTDFAKMNIFFGLEDYDITYRLIEIYGTDKLGVVPNAIVYHNHRETFLEAYKQFEGYGKGAAFWLWSYNKVPFDLKGSQELPQNIGCFLSHIFKIIKAIPKYRIHYIKTRKQQYSIIFSLLYSINGWLLRIAFHLGTYKGQKYLNKYEKNTSQIYSGYK